MERRLKDMLVGGNFGAVPAGHVKRMKAIRSTGNKSTEKRLRGLLVRAGVRGWKLNPPKLPGKPDFLFPDPKLVIFLDGCYWHGCPRCGHVGEVNRAYWSGKIQGNRDRDVRHTQTLEKDGYTVLRFWEHELAESPARCVERIKEAIKAAEYSDE
jgi:DNA mismatch endonuclease, patch repair protein